MITLGTFLGETEIKTISEKGNFTPSLLDMSGQEGQMLKIQNCYNVVKKEGAKPFFVVELVSPGGELTTMPRDQFIKANSIEGLTNKEVFTVVAGEKAAIKTTTPYARYSCTYEALDHSNKEIPFKERPFKAEALDGDTVRPEFVKENYTFA